MKTGYVICIIAMCAVLILFLLNYLAPSFPGWIVFIAAGIAIVAATGISKSKEL